MSPERSRKHLINVLRIALFAALLISQAGAAARAPNENPSGDCGKQVTEKQSRRWNPLKAPQKFEHKLSDFALKVSSIGITEPAPVCPTVPSYLTKAANSTEGKAKATAITPGL
jgi:hypothetical protein